MRKCAFQSEYFGEVEMKVALLACFFPLHCRALVVPGQPRASAARRTRCVHGDAARSGWSLNLLNRAL
jgi:hypothetical protein